MNKNDHYFSCLFKVLHGNKLQMYIVYMYSRKILPEVHF